MFLFEELRTWQKYGKSWVPKVIIGDVRKVLHLFPDNFIDCVITSPPYWKQRDYGHPAQIGQEETPEEYVAEIVKVFDILRSKLKRTSVVFLNVGYKYLNEELILIPEMIALEMQKRGYMLKNKIIWYKPNAMPTPARNRLNNVYEPVMVFVKREAKELYYFNLDELSEKPKTLTEYTRILNLKPEDYLGAKVLDSLRYRESLEGVVSGVRYSSESKRIYEILVKWSNGVAEWIPMGDPLRDYPEEVKFACPLCGGVLTYWDIVLSIANTGKLLCSHCGGLLGKTPESFPKPLIEENSNTSQLRVIELVVDEVDIKKYITKMPKSSKYLNVQQVFSSSPAGRLAVSGEYITIKRKWRAPQPLIAEYLSFWRKLRGISIKDIDEKLVYRDTAGHWFRKDFGEWGKGGSIPRPSDWLKLKEILEFNDIYDRVVLEIIAELQTVKVHEKGKNPGDVWTIQLEQYPEAHFAVFPQKLVENAVKLGCPPGGVVLDPFAGSGTVGEVAMKLGRKALLIELIEDYVKLIEKRCKKIEVIKI